MWAGTVPVVQGQLEPGEKLLWSGRPRQGLVLRASDALLIPFSLMWSGFAIFWEMSVLLSSAPAILTFWGIPFVLIGLHLVFGRFAVDAMQRGKCWYGITDERIIVIFGLFGFTAKSLNLRTLTEVSVDQKSDGSGTISFGSAPASAWSYSAIWPWGERQLPPRFEMISDVKSVYEIIRRAQRIG